MNGIQMDARYQNYEVKHPDFPTVIVPSIGPDSATVEAARRWGVAEDWSRIACDCTARRLGPVRKPMCKRCGREFGAAGDTQRYCSDCQRVEDQLAREKAGIRRADKRPGMGR
ncbi:MAG: hypothetical protein LUG13_04420 [Oscillospiraceae bacterium]|nr:hypothetical protein [Oscillospiraceae bacterium]